MADRELVDEQHSFDKAREMLAILKDQGAERKSLPMYSHEEMGQITVLARDLIRAFEPELNKIVSAYSFDLTASMMEAIDEIGYDEDVVAITEIQSIFMVFSACVELLLSLHEKAQAAQARLQEKKQTAHGNDAIAEMLRRLGGDHGPTLN